LEALLPHGAVGSPRPLGIDAPFGNRTRRCALLPALQRRPLDLPPRLTNAIQLGHGNTARRAKSRTLFRQSNDCRTMTQSGCRSPTLEAGLSFPLAGCVRPSAHPGAAIVALSPLPGATRPQPLGRSASAARRAAPHRPDAARTGPPGVVSGAGGHDL